METHELHGVLTDIVSDPECVGLVWFKAYTPLSMGPQAIDTRKEWEREIRAVYGSLDSTLVWDRKLSIAWTATGECSIELRN